MKSPEPFSSFVVGGSLFWICATIPLNATPSPFILQQTVIAPLFSTSTLPTLQMWWRVRANDASGSPGNWSSIRRVEVKN